MRPIYLAPLQLKTRPVLVLTRLEVIPYLRWVTIAPITSTIRGLATELPVGPANGLHHPSVVSLDNIATIDKELLGRQLGFLAPAEEPRLTAAIHAAFSLV